MILEANANESEIHQLAMKEVGDHLSKMDMILTVNSQLKKTLSLCVLKTKNFILLLLEFLYPDNPKNLDSQMMERVINHGIKYKATLLCIGFANAHNYEMPLTKNDSYAVNFDGLQIMEYLVFCWVIFSCNYIPTKAKQLQGFALKPLITFST